MKREEKNTAVYFTHDADMRNDIKIKALRKKFSHKGYAVWCYILEMLTDSNDYEICYNEKTQILVASDFEISVEELKQIIDYCIYLDLLQLNVEKLYSTVLKSRFAILTEYREKKRLAGIKGMQSRWGNKGGESEKVIAENNNVITNDNTLITTDNIEENSIVKYSKEKNSIEIKYPYQDIVRLWNEICIDLPKVNKLSDERRKKIKLRLSEFGAESSWLPTAEALFEKLQNSTFLRGDNKSQWRATFDWLFSNSTNWVKVIEDNYSNCKEQQGTLFSEHNQVKLGSGEYIDNTGRRTYGTGQIVVPFTAPPRPSEKCVWSSESSKWIMI